MNLILLNILRQKKIAIAVINKNPSEYTGIACIKLTKYGMSGDFQYLLINKNGYNYYSELIGYYHYNFGNCLIKTIYDCYSVIRNKLEIYAALGNNYQINIFSNSADSFKNLDINITGNNKNYECKQKPYGKMDDELQRKVEDLYEMFLAKKHFESLSK